MEEDRVRDELSAVKEAVEQLTGLRSRWSGNVILLGDAELTALKGRVILAEKRWNCDILLNLGLATLPARWRTYIHEMLHSVSTGLNEADLGRFRGWEEGVVEQILRLNRQRVLNSAGVSLLEATFAEADRASSLNRYIEALEALRVSAAMEADLFYMMLLHTPLRDRLSLVRSLRPEPDYQRLFAYTVGRLR